MTPWTTPVSDTPSRITKLIERLTPEDLEAMVKKAVEDSREEVERLTRPYRRGLRNSPRVF